MAELSLLAEPLASDDVVSDAIDFLQLEALVSPRGRPDVGIISVSIFFDKRVFNCFLDLEEPVGNDGDKVQEALDFIAALSPRPMESGSAESDSSDSETSSDSEDSEKTQPQPTPVPLISVIKPTFIMAPMHSPHPVMVNTVEPPLAEDTVIVVKKKAEPVAIEPMRSPHPVFSMPLAPSDEVRDNLLLPFSTSFVS